MASAYRSGTQRLAINTGYGKWVVYDLRKYDPKIHNWRKCPVAGTASDRRAAIAIARQGGPSHG